MNGTGKSAGPPSFAPCLNPATLTGLGLEEFLRGAASAGFAEVEVPVQQVIAYGPGRARELLDTLGLRAAAASGILPAGPVLPHPVLTSDAVFSAAREGLADRLTAFQAIGCPVATIVLNPRVPGDPRAARATATARIRELARACAGHGVTLAVEAVSVTCGLPAELDGPAQVAATLPQLRDILEPVGGNVTACVDSFHWAAAGADPRHLDGLRIGHVQIADAPPGIPKARWTDAMRLFPGDGLLDWSALGGALRDAGYAGPVSVELFNPQLRALPEADIARRALDSARRCWLNEAGR
ncbi:MAG: sugar phosphate isomerase/epimerase family protein [Trebonia sp.]